jgi:hypothetical protein
MKYLLLIIFSVFGLANCSSGERVLAAKYDICFKEDLPGASDRYVQYTPVRCSDKSVVLGEPVGGEYAGLEFSDTDADGVPEIVVSSESGCRWRFCIHPTRTVVKVKPENPPVFTVVSETELPH